VAGHVRASPHSVATCQRKTRSDSERPLAIHGKVVGALAVLVLPVIAAAPLAAGASSAPSPKSLLKELLPSADAKRAGFTEVAEKATTTSKTGVKSCPNGAQEAFQSATAPTGVASEIVGCTTGQAASAVMKSARSSGAATSSVPPKQLGPSAVEVSGGGSTYAIYWQRGREVELVALTTNVSASGSSSTSTTTVTPPITAAQQRVLAKAAEEQDAVRG
jgi:hypothetical protein